MADDYPIIIKPPALMRQLTISEKRALSANGQMRLRNSQFRNPREPQGTTNSIAFKTSGRNGVDCAPDSTADSGDEEFYSSLRQPVLQKKSRRIKKSPRKTKPPLDDVEHLREMAHGAKETKTVLQGYKTKIVSLQEDMEHQDYAMQNILKENEALEKKVATFARKEKMYISGEQSLDQSILDILEVNKTLQMEVERLKPDKLNKLDHVVVDVEGQNITEEYNKLRIKEKQLEEALSAARHENGILIEEVNSNLSHMGDHSYSQGQSALERTQLRRKEAQLERSLAAAQKENQQLRMEVRSRDPEVENNITRLKQKHEHEMQNLRDELEINRRIVHTKRSLIQKEMSDEMRDEMRNEMEERLTKELTTTIAADLEAKMRYENEIELRNLREEDEEKVRVVQKQIPVLEYEIDRLRGDLCETREENERVTGNIEANFQRKMEFMINNFSQDRDQEKQDFAKSIEALSIENERTKAHAAKEKQEYRSRVRDEVTVEIQTKIQFLASRITELTNEKLDMVQQGAKEKELYGDNIREQLTKEREELLEEAAKEKETYGESVRQEMTITQNQINDSYKKEMDSLLKKIDEGNAHNKKAEELQEEIATFIRRNEELEKEKDSLYRILKETQEELRLTKENYAKDLEELEPSRLELEASKSEILKLKKQKKELIAMADQFKNDATDMANEVKKIKGHFKFAVLVEYEEKILEMENELERLESIIEDSNVFNSEDLNKINEQYSQLEQYKAKEKAQDTEVKRLSKELMSTVSDLELKESRITELKDIILAKETELYKLNQYVKDHQKSLGARENELTRVQNEQDIFNERLISTQTYKQKISQLNEELMKHKSRLEHCRCEGKPFGKFDHGQSTNSEPQAESEHLQERIQRLSVMLKVAENNHHKDKLTFDATNERFDKKLLACNDEIAGLYSEVSRLKNLLNRSQRDLRSSLEREANHQTKLTQEGQTERSHPLQNEQQELLHKIEAAEKVVQDATQYKSDSKKEIQHLRDELSLRSVEKIKIAQELRDSKLLFREAVMSWRVETRGLKKQLDQSKTSERVYSSYSGLVPQNLFDDYSETKDDASKYQQRFLQIIAEDDEPEQQEFESKLEHNFSYPSYASFQISDMDSGSWSREEKMNSQQRPASPSPHSEIREDLEDLNYNSASNPTKNDEAEIDSGSWSRKDKTKSQQRPASPIPHSTSDHKYDEAEKRDDSAEMINHSASNLTKNSEAEIRDDESKPGNDASSEAFTRMLNISEHTSSIEMKFGHQPKQSGEQFEEQSGKQPSEQSDERSGEQPDEQNASTLFDTFQEFKNEYIQYLDKNEFSEIIAKKIGNPFAGNNNTSNAPQTHLDGNNLDAVQSNRDCSLSMSSRTSATSDIDTRDDNMQHVHGSQRYMRDKSPLPSSDSASYQRNLRSESESEDCSSKGDDSKRSNVSERSRVLRKKMSDLLEIKNNIKQRSNSSVAADTNRNERVAKQQHYTKPTTTTATTTTTTTTTATTKSGAPWGLALEKNPKLYKFLKSKRSSGSLLQAVPTDEHLDRRDQKPFDESSKNSWRE